ncbi:MAG: hypothetical protein M3229_02445, partial [Actinomycetota bacterium]|nr:hypothetical protein [Actinomycetota bacterium]
ARALVAGPLVHALGDLTPHEDIPSTWFEAVSGALAVAFVARSRGPLHPTTIGALAASIPDVEHVLPWRLRGRKLFPTHRHAGWHKRGGVPAWVQLTAAALVLALVAQRA